MNYKKYASDNDSAGGVWRTVGGRRIFIKDGQSLESAMRESGKFKNQKQSYIDVDRRMRANIERVKKEYDDEMAEARRLGRDDLEEQAREKKAREIEKYKKLQDENKKDYTKNKEDRNIAKTLVEVPGFPNYEYNTKTGEVKVKDYDKKLNEMKKENFDEAIERIDKIKSFDDRKQAISDYVDKTGVGRNVVNDALAEKEYNRHLSEEYDKRFGEKNKEDYKRQIENEYALNFGDSSLNYEDAKNVPFKIKENAVKRLREYEKEYIKKINSAKNDEELEKADKYYKEKTGKNWYDDKEKREYELYKQANEDRVNNKYATNNEGGIDDNTSKFADEAIKHWEDENRKYKEKYGKDDEMALNFKKQWEKEKENRLKGEKENKYGYSKDEWGKFQKMPMTNYEREHFHNEEDLKRYQNTKNDILEYYTSDFGYNGNKKDAFIEQMDAVRYNNKETPYDLGKRIAENGNYLIYNDDMKEYLKNKGINANDDNVFDKYIDYMGQVQAEMYKEFKNGNQITSSLRQKAYQKYLKEHPNSKMSFEDFKNMSK